MPTDTSWGKRRVEHFNLLRGHILGSVYVTVQFLKCLPCGECLLSATPFLQVEGAELPWSPDGTRFAYHTDAAGDPIFVTEPNGKVGRQIYAAARGVHCHFSVWSPKAPSFILFRASRPMKWTSGGFARPVDLRSESRFITRASPIRPC